MSSLDALLEVRQNGFAAGVRQNGSARRRRRLSRLGAQICYRCS